MWMLFQMETIFYWCFYTWASQSGWSSPVNLNNGDNIISLDLKDAAWAQ